MRLTIDYSNDLFLMLIGLAVGCTSGSFAVYFNMVIVKQCGTWAGCTLGYTMIGIMFIAIVLLYWWILKGKVTFDSGIERR